MKNYFKYILITLLVFPVFSFAIAESGKLSRTKTLLGSVRELIEILIPIAFGLAILFFFWGIAKFIFSTGAGKDDGKQIMVWGVLAIFVMSAIWGIVAFIGGTFGVDVRTEVTIPTIKK